MSKIRIPFLPEFKDRMLSGEKTCTARNKKYGEPGDTFPKFGASFLILIVEELPLRKVRDQLHNQEGFPTRAGFQSVWDRLHPRKKYIPDHEVWVHHFKLVEDSNA